MPELSPGETYNIAGRNKWISLEVVRKVCSLMDSLRPGDASHHGRITFMADRPGHEHRYAIDAGKLEAEIGAQETLDRNRENG
jgi:dTDP-glucose 4,6-dehydratase